MPRSYGWYDRDEPVTFYRPDGDTEGKDIGWCLDNGFFEIHEGLWSGKWYYRHHPEELEKKKQMEANKKKRKWSEPEGDNRDSYKELEIRRLKDRRGELLDELYGCPECLTSYRRDQVSREVDKLDVEIAKVNGTAA